MVKNRSKNMYYPDGFQEDVDTLMTLLEERGVDLENSKLGILSESKLFRHLVVERLKELGVQPKTSESKNL